MTTGPGRRILVATPDTLSDRMAGPAIRAWHIAADLAVEHQVTLLSPSGTDLTNEAFELAAGAAAADVGRRAAVADVIIVQGDGLDRWPALGAEGRPVVVDLYDPFLFEQLEQTRPLEPGRRATILDATRRSLVRSLERGDVFLCASDKQRDLWIGHLAAVGRLNPLTYDDDPTVRRLLRVVPFGLPDQPPRQTRHAIRGAVPGVGPDDRVVLWGGGVYDWLDPLTVIRAVAVLRDRIPDLRLVFLGMRHPDPGGPEMAVAARARALAAELGVAGSHVHFLDGWVPYAERADWLLDADVAVSAHHDHLETAYAFRTRILDCLWTGVPVVATAGDTLGDLIQRHGLGLTVPPADVAATAAALETLLLDRSVAAAARAALGQIAPEFSWTNALRPLREFCRDPHRAPDRADPRIRRQLAPLRRSARRPSRMAREVDLARAALEDGGPMAVAGQLVERARRRRARRPPPDGPDRTDPDQPAGDALRGRPRDAGPDVTGR